MLKRARHAASRPTSYRAVAALAAPATSGSASGSPAGSVTGPKGQGVGRTETPAPATGPTRVTVSPSGVLLRRVFACFRDWVGVDSTLRGRWFSRQYLAAPTRSSDDPRCTFVGSRLWVRLCRLGVCLMSSTLLGRARLGCRRYRGWLSVVVSVLVVGATLAASPTPVAVASPAVTAGPSTPANRPGPAGAPAVPEKAVALPAPPAKPSPTVPGPRCVDHSLLVQAGIPGLSPAGTGKSVCGPDKSARDPHADAVLARPKVGSGRTSLAAALPVSGEYPAPDWVQQSPPTQPVATWDSTMVYDSARGVTLLFGGSYVAGGNYYQTNQTWSWNGSTWSLLSPATSPPARAGAFMAFDSVTNTVVLFGGRDAVWNPLNDTWIWNGST
jgi:hypothetical protein